MYAGISIAWITTIAFNSNTSVNSTAQYSIDNGTLFPILVVGPNSTIQTYDLLSFQTPDLFPGPHHLFVKYAGGSDNAAPLILDHLVIQSSTIPSSTSSSRRTLSKGAIAGIVISSLVGLAIIFILVRWAMKRKSPLAPGSQRRPGTGSGGSSRPQGAIVIAICSASNLIDSVHVEPYLPGHLLSGSNQQVRDGCLSLVSSKPSFPPLPLFHVLSSDHDIYCSIVVFKNNSSEQTFLAEFFASAGCEN